MKHVYFISSATIWSLSWAGISDCMPAESMLEFTAGLLAVAGALGGITYTWWAITQEMNT